MSARTFATLGEAATYRLVLHEFGIRTTLYRISDSADGDTYHVVPLGWAD